MADIMRFAPADSTVLLCRIFRETVLCVHQVTEADKQPRVSYERGRPMPLFKGATSKIILAHLPLRDLRHLYGAYRGQIAAAKLGDAWEAFRNNMAVMRKAGHSITRAEVDPDCIGIAVPILDGHRRVMSSLSYVIPALEERTITRLVSLVAIGAREMEQGMRADEQGAASTGTAELERLQAVLATPRPGVPATTRNRAWQSCPGARGRLYRRDDAGGADSAPGAAPGQAVPGGQTAWL